MELPLSNSEREGLRASAELLRRTFDGLHIHPTAQ
jgi:hypothetical protein